MVTEQIANLSAGNRRLGSSPSLSAQNAQNECSGHFFFAPNPSAEGPLNAGGEPLSLKRNTIGVDACTQNNFNYLCPRLQRSGRGLVRLRRLVWDQEIAGSNPAAPTAKRSVQRPGVFCSFKVRCVPLMSG